MQGRFKRDGSAAAEPEPNGATDRGTPADAPNGGENAERPKAPKAKGPSGPGTRIALRNWRISTRLVSLLALPVVAATTLGGLRIDDSLTNVDQLDHMKLLTELTGKATDLADALQEERDRSAGPLTKGNDKDDDVVAPREHTDNAIKAFGDVTAKVDANDPTMVGVNTTLVDITKQLRKIKDVREKAYDDHVYIAKTVNAYNGLITSLLSLSQDMAQATSNSDMIAATRALAAFANAKEYASIQRAVISAGLANPSGPQLSENDRQYGQAAMDNEDEATKRFTAIRGDGGDGELMQALNGGVMEIASANTYAKRVLDKSGALKSDPLSYRDWYDRDTIKINEMSKIEKTLLSEMDQKAQQLRDDAQQEAILNGALIVLVLGISLVGAFFVARTMVRSLRRLQDTAQKVAQERLPELVKQLSESDPQDVDTSVESVGVHSRDEIGKVAAAFDEVHREAVRLAAEQALLRGNVNAMFTNLSRRSQGLIQRQLSLISELESREADPDQLSSLFKLDHLATRMRRNGENLLVLAGEEPGRRWTRPVPLVDVLRAAASEVEQYERIELTGVPPTEVAGRVVNDLVHLLAELLENATSFSSPQTKVKVTGHALPDGRVLVEIHDTGIGLSPEDLAAINERLASPPTVDVSVSRRMGLFVVGRLSLRHGIRIQLRPSDSGGTTALVMLPVDVAQGGKKPAPGVPGAPGGAKPAPAMPAGPGAGAGAGAPGGGALGSAPSRRQMPPSGPRPALPGRGGTTSSGLPTRPVGGPGQGGGPAAAPSGPSLFDAPPQRAGNTPAAGGPGADGRSPLPPRGGKKGPAAIRPVGNKGAGRPQLPNRGEQSGRPAPSWGNDQAPATPNRPAPVDDWPLAADGAPRAGQETPRGHEDVEAPRSGGPADTASFPQLSPVREPGDNSTGQFALPGGGAQDGGDGSTGYPRLTAVPAPDNGGTGQFPAHGADGPSGTGQFALPGGNDQSGTTGQYPARGDNAASRTGQFPAPGAGGPGDTASFPQLPAREDRSGTTGQFPAHGADGPSGTGQFALPGGNDQSGTTGQYPAPGRNDSSGTGQYPRPVPADQHGPAATGQFPAPGAGDSSGTGQFALPGGNDRSGTGQYPARGDNTASRTGQFPAPGAGGPGDTASFPQLPAREDRSGTTGQFPAPGANDPSGTGQFALPGGGDQSGTTGQYPAPEAGSLPPAGPGDGRTPLFEQLESNWFRGAAGGAQPAPGPRLPRREPGQTQPPAAPQPAQDNWRQSPNDERWRRAEQVREPAAGGTTASGLPRRVPRANLVEGTAEQQQSQASGPQVSRAPDDVRGRLTNLRRGIQQGRQAGSGSSTGSHHVGPTYQQER
ncbi:sensor histidine kinase [Streptomyces orinoci]|uniref:histidine kinase n=1 Tax=Streptomyces orinoci TaxID=67339 RepID=A0ABV3K2M3_STRON|nr:nitrate- and nitrite sensing domain-containing protein [Streptomyces orinoci]